MTTSKYNSTEGLKITYLLGAGASCNTIPIWKMQGESMIQVAKHILGFIDNQELKEDPIKGNLYKNPNLTEIAENILKYGEHAEQYGSLDIYAKRLFLLGDKKGINELKLSLSIYFDLWENFWPIQAKRFKKVPEYNIDKRYFSLLAVLLEKVRGRLNPKLNEHIKFITWNYDLQLEMAYKSFMSNTDSTLFEVDSELDYMYNNTMDRKKLDVIHLNGYRGVFEALNRDGDKQLYPNVGQQYMSSFDQYLRGLTENVSQFRKSELNYNSCIKYAWESDSESLSSAKSIMAETNILIIIGYSFPSFNREVDSTLINEFEKTGYHRIIYQDPNGNYDIIRSIFNNPNDVIFEKENIGQFYLPHEFLFPSSGEKVRIS